VQGCVRTGARICVTCEAGTWIRNRRPVPLPMAVNVEHGHNRLPRSACVPLRCSEIVSVTCLVRNACRAFERSSLVGGSGRQHDRIGREVVRHQRFGLAPCRNRRCAGHEEGSWTRGRSIKP